MTDKQSKPPSKTKSKAPSASARSSSKKSKVSITIAAQRAGLLVEAAAIEEEEELEQQMLKLQQQVKRLKVKTQLDKLQAEQEILDSEVESEEASSKAQSNETEQAKMDRVSAWVDTTYAQPVADPEVDEPQHQQTETTDKCLNPLAPEFQQTSRTIEEMINTLHMPKAEMMTFDGDPIKYWTFIKAFDNSVGKYNVDEHAKLARLLQYCTGRAHRVIESCAAMDRDGYVRARHLLHERFGDKYAISASWVNRVTSGARITNDSLQDFADELLSFRETLYATDCLSEINQRVLVQVVERLQVYLQHRWKHQATKIRANAGNPGIDDLVRFVQSAAREVNDPVYGTLGVSNKSKQEQSQVTKKKGFHGATAARADQGERKCVACNANDCQSLFKCEQFKKMSPEKRFEIAKSNRLCYNCLRHGHSSADCKADSTCNAKNCKIKHTKFLHFSRDQKSESDQRNNSQPPAIPSNTSAVVCNHIKSSSVRVALPIVKVKVSGRSGYSSIAYALLDNGSTNSFCSTALLRDLRSHGTKASLSLTTLENNDSKMNTSVHDLEVSDTQGQNKVTMHQVFESPSIPVTRDCLIESEDLEKWGHLKGLDIPVLPDGDTVQMLIGQDCPEILKPLEVRASGEYGAKSAPFATRTLFGWTLNGPLGTYRRSTASVHFVSTTLERQVEEFWKIDGAQLNSSAKGLSVEDRKALHIMRDTVSKEDGHYSVAIPFRENRFLPNNKVLAEKRLASLAKKLEHNPSLKQDYDKNIHSLIQKGNAEKAPEDSKGEQGAIWYLPHHAVINPNKSKIRVVFDCAAKQNGTSLNDKVLQGPDLTNGLLGILLRFRQFPVAISADVEAMFHQVRVPKEDRDVLRFLWWPDGDIKKEPETYRMTVHLFGGTWSPSVCTYALQQTARDNIRDFEPAVIDAVLHEFYVDDCLKSVKTETEAIEMATQLPKLLARGGFRLCKWLSNSKEVLQAIPESERASGLHDLNFQALPVERTLGVLWNVNSDTFTYATKPSNEPLTRRGLLGVVCSVYDPLGFVTPFTVRGKRLVQDLAREKIGWDEPLSVEHLSNWQKWLNELEDIPHFQTDRCFQLAEFGNIQRTELHHFSDASTTAYGSASYIRVVNTEGQVHCSLLFTRSRVTPLKQMTIPRLELAAAALSVQQDEMISRELSIPIDQSVFWTDSTIVLAYIRNEEKRFHTYVANRLAAIHEGSSVSQWRHVKSESNPADDISRGLHMQDLIQSQRWIHGPEFLRQPTDLQPSKTELTPINLDHDPEVKRSVTTCSTEVERDILNDLFERYSSWTKLKRAVAWLQTFSDYLLAKARQQKPAQIKKVLSVQELKKAETAIIRYVQRREYKQEMQKPKTGIRRKDRLYKLDPVLTDRGILVCGIRGKGVPLNSADNSQQPILPKDHHISKLIVRHFHEMSGHSGREYTVAEIRSHYWIPGVRTTVRRLINECFVCRRLFCAPGNQQMGDLPKERLAMDKPPFTNVGVDCFGPFMIKSGRKQSKRYGCIFTCLTSRAVHLEILDSMDTFSFINSLQRFICRRGAPETICCDNGTNFVGAERELRESMKQWNQQSIDGFFSHREIQWKFNPPTASHMGGAWERLIRSVRRTLSGLITQQTMSDDTLTTLMCLVESIINNRPLTTVSDDPNDFEPLTPNHLLLLRPRPLFPPGVFDPKDCFVRKRWRQVQYLANVFWHRWLKEYLPLIQLRPKWRERKQNLRVGDVVLIVDYGAPRNLWQIGRVSDVTVGSGGLVRSAKVRTSKSTLTRPVTKLCYLEGRSREDFMSAN